MSEAITRQRLPLKKEKDFVLWAGIVLVLITTLLTARVAQFDFLEGLRVLPGVVGFLWNDFLPPDVTAFPNLFQSLLDTIAMAIVSTIVASLIALGLSFLCAAPTTPHPAVKAFVRGFASMLRNIPSLAWTILLVPAFGIGKSVGVLALSIGSLGSLTRFFAETIEEIDVGKLETIRAAGGSYGQILRAAVLPQCLPGFIAWMLYSLELAIRASAIIGMVGGGGIGFFIQSTIKLFQYKKASLAILIVALLVVSIEYASKRLREKIL